MAILQRLVALGIPGFLFVLSTLPTVVGTKLSIAEFGKQSA